MKNLIFLLILFLAFSCSSTNPSSDTGVAEAAQEVERESPVSLEESAAPGKSDPEGSPVPDEQSAVQKEQEFDSLSDKEIEAIIRDTIPSSFLPVTENRKSIKIIYRDLDQNGFRDAFLLVVKNREGMDADFSTLSDYSRLVESKTQPVDLFLSVYLQIQGTMISMFRIPVGSGQVISGFSPVEIKKGSDLPLGINISLQSAKGTEREWIIFSSYNKFSLFSLNNNISTYSHVYDLDNDGFMDIVEWEDGLEEGTGYETYLTWYRWNGREYREYLGTNIVRNLNEFLEQSRLYLSFNQNAEFLRHGLRPDDFREFLNSEKDYQIWFKRIFRPVPGSPVNDDMNECGKFRAIIFPQVFENPFSPANAERRIFNFNVRFICEDGFSFIRTARIMMNPNPFRKPQFSFYLD